MQCPLLHTLQNTCYRIAFHLPRKQDQIFLDRCNEKDLRIHDRHLQLKGLSEMNTHKDILDRSQQEHLHTEQNSYCCTPCHPSHIQDHTGVCKYSHQTDLEIQSRNKFYNLKKCCYAYMGILDRISHPLQHTPLHNGCRSLLH